MRFDRNYRSDFVEDRRGMTPSGGGGGLIVLLLWIFRRFGIAGVVIAVVVYFVATRGSCGGAGQPLGGGEPEPGGAGEAELVAFVSFVFDDAQTTWAERFAKRGQTYPYAKLVLFTSRVDSACGLASSAVGPFYCPSDQRVYIDLSFYRALRDRLGAPGDFAQAYVIAHEVGHHVQNVLGDLSHKGEGASGGQVRTELQADCLAGVWAHSTQRRDLLERGDLEEALRAAAAIGDDTLQREGTGTVRPETFTHGTSGQRARWFGRGYEHGTIDACDTFSSSQL